MVYSTIMPARKLLDSKHIFNHGAIQQLVIWELPEPVLGSKHIYKYRLYYGKNHQRLVGYDNERGKGDHKHICHQEYPYTFISIEQLINDFLADVKEIHTHECKPHNEQ